MDQQNQTPTERLLGAMYKNVKMGADSILNILPKAEDKEMRSELTGLMDKFEGCWQEKGRKPRKRAF